MKNAVKITAVLMILAAALVSCSGATDPIAVDDLTIDSVTMVTNSTDTTKPPVTYSAKVSWNIASITADDTASAGLDSIRVEITGSDVELLETLSADATTYTFEGLLPGDQCWLKVTAVYVDGTYDENYASVDRTFTGGPWYKTGVSSATSRNIDDIDVGHVNQLDGFPAGSFALGDFYFYNTYRTEYVVDDIGDEAWLIVSVEEVLTDGSNDTDTRRETVNWLSDDVYLLDASVSGLSTYDDIPYVDMDIYTVDGTKVFSLTGSSTEGTIAAADFTTLLNSVNSGYYADKDGVFFIRAKCTGVPTSYSTNNATDKHGWWGVAMPGTRVARD